jgi:hypothetical protein
VPTYFVTRYAVVNLRNRYVEPSEPAP